MMKKKPVVAEKKATTPAKERAIKRTAPKPATRNVQQRPEPRLAVERMTAQEAKPVTSSEHNQPEPTSQTAQQDGRKRKGGFAQQMHRIAKPNELHPGQTAENGSTHDRPGSQPERVRHLYPNGNQPNAGSARSTQYKGKHRENEPQGE